MKFKVYNDIHIFSSHEIKTIFDESKNVILNGDIVDLLNCKKSQVEEAKEKIAQLKSIYGVRYISGNHELGFWNKYNTRDGVLFIHGDYILWGDEKSNKFRSQRPGSGWFKRHIAIPVIDAFRPKSGKLSFDQIKSCIDLLKVEKCHTIVMGHLHYKEVIDLKGNMRIIVLPRGMHEIEV